MSSQNNFDSFVTNLLNELIDLSPTIKLLNNYKCLPNFNLIKSNTVSLLVRDILTESNYFLENGSRSYLYNKDKITPGAQYLIDIIKKYPNKKFIILSGLERLETEINLPNTYIVPIGGCITNWSSTYLNVKPILDKNFESTLSFISLNRTARIHRVINVCNLHILDLDKFGHISLIEKINDKNFLNFCSWDFKLQSQFSQQLIDIFPQVVEFYNQNQGDPYIDSFDKHGQWNNPKNFENLRSFYQNSFIEIVSETTYTEPEFNLTEKYLNSVYGCNFPIIIGNCGMVKFLREFGFDVFDDVINHDYDDIIDPVSRIKTLYELNSDLLKDVGLVKKLWQERKDRFIANIEFAKYQMYENFRIRAITEFTKAIND
jgi:hypothetical protein